jgi:hypothetical protein
MTDEKKINLYDQWKKRVDKNYNKNYNKNIIDDYENNSYIWREVKKEKIVISEPTIADVLKKFKLEELINAIGIEKVEAILRAHKINKIKNKLK